MKKTYSFENLNQIADGDKEFITSVVQAFLEEIPQDLELMLQAVKSQNKQLVYYYAHKMKPNLALLGLNMEDSIKAIENWSSTDDNIDAVQGHIRHTAGVLREVFIELKRDFRL